MNNRGWGLSEMLGILLVFAACILVIIIISNENFKGVIPNSNNSSLNVSTKKNSDDHTKEENSVDYTQFEDEMVKGAKEYINDQTDIDSPLVITLNELVKLNYVDSILDSNNNDEECLGYVLYSAKEESYKAYLRCPGSYRTIGYEQTLES